MNKNLNVIKEKNMLDSIIKADTILFIDMDGTLIDTDYANFLSYQKAINFVINNGFDISYNPKNRFNRNYLELLIPNLLQTDYEKIIKKKEDFYKELLAETKLNEVLAEILFKFSKTNRIYLITNCRKDRAFMTLNHYRLLDKFDKIFYRQILDNDEKVNKYQNAITELDIPPNLIVAFENDEIEIIYAKKAGIKVINPIFI